MDLVIKFYDTMMNLDIQQILTIWLLFAFWGTLSLYVGFGFVMAAIRARNNKQSQTVIYVIDVTIAIFFLILDVLLNVVVYPFICLDLRPKNIFTTISHRMSRYNSDPKERMYRKYIASLFAAALDGKDVTGDHIKGQDIYFKWLG